MGLTNVSVTVSDTLGLAPSGPPCARVPEANVTGTVALLCQASGRYLLVAGTAVELCSVQVYAAGERVLKEAAALLTGDAHPDCSPAALQ